MFGDPLGSRDAIKGPALLFAKMGREVINAPDEAITNTR